MVQATTVRPVFSLPPVMWIPLWLLLGAALSVGFVAYARMQGRAARWVFALGLVGAALVYLAFSFVGPTARWTAAECGGLVVFGTIAWAGLRHAPAWLVLGWALHPAWDVGVHWLSPFAAYSPDWYAVACVSFDLTVATYLAWWEWTMGRLSRPAPHRSLAE